MLWRCATYNPHSAWQLDRKQEIAAEFEGYHVLGLCGTKYRRHHSDPACRVSNVGSFRLYEWGHPGKSEHAAGVAIYIRAKVFSEYNIRHVYDIPSAYQGRLGILRVKRRDVDFCIVVAYPWVQGRTVSERSRIERFWQYIGSIIAGLPHRCVPIILTDANARNGLCRGEGGAIVAIDSPAIGKRTPEMENSSGVAFRNLLEEQHLCSVNSWCAPGHTYFGNVVGVKSRIDHACLPQSLLPSVVSCGVMYSVGSRLQRVYGPGKRDHMPVNMVFRHASCFTGQELRQKRMHHWDQSLLVDGVLRGDRRRELVTAVTRNCCELGLAKFSHPDCAELPPSPDMFWKDFSAAIRVPAHELYHRQKPSTRPRHFDTQQALQLHQDACAAVAALPRSIVPVQERHHAHQFLAEVLFQWRAAAKFYHTRTVADKLLKRDARKAVADRVVEFNHAHHVHDSAHVWRVGRLLSGFKVGPICRRYDNPLSSHPDAQEWVRFMAQAGKDGGCLGRSIEWNEVEQASFEAVRQPVRSILDARRLATEDLHQVLALLRVRQLANPNAYYARRRLGIGYGSYLDGSVFRRCLHGLFISIRLYDVMPVHWNLSQTFQIDKQNGSVSVGCAGVRTINTFEPMGKVLTKTLWDGGARRSERPWAAGYVKHKSRITPIMQRRIIKARLQRAGQSHCDSFYDAKNAFPSVLRPICDAVIDQTCRLDDTKLLKQRNNQAVMRIVASDKDVYIHTGSGSLQGDAHAGAQFLEQYHPALDAWAQKLSEIEGSELLVWDPIGEVFADASISTYADDLARTVLCSTPHDLAARLHRANHELRDVLEPIGIAQNLDKQEHVPCFVRSQAASCTRLVFHQRILPGRTKYVAKYLGSLHQLAGNCGMEVDQRLRKADVGWLAMGKFWFRSGVLRAPLVQVFKGMVYSTLLSGLEALCLSKTHIERLDKYALKRGRQLMHGGACIKSEADGQVTYKALPSIAVFRFLRIVPAHIELRVRRLRFWQQVARYPQLHSVLLGCIFSQFDFEPHASLDPDGRPTRHANPWLQLLADDIHSMSVLDSAALMIDELGGRVLPIFTELREEFIRIDVSEFRARFLGNAVPPPGWAEPPGAVDEVLQIDDVEPMHTCQCRCDDGSICRKAFHKYSQLFAHMLHTKGGNHGERPLFSLAAVSNICPWCRCKFASRLSASHHIKNSFIRGRCTGQGSCINPPLEMPKSLACPACKEPCESFDALLQHLCEHDSPAAFFARQQAEAPVR